MGAGNSNSNSSSCFCEGMNNTEIANNKKNILKPMEVLETKQLFLKLIMILKLMYF